MGTQDGLTSNRGLPHMVMQLLGWGARGAGWRASQIEKPWSKPWLPSLSLAAREQTTAEWSVVYCVSRYLGTYLGRKTCNAQQNRGFGAPPPHCPPLHPLSRTLNWQHESALHSPPHSPHYMQPLADKLMYRRHGLLLPINPGWCSPGLLGCQFMPLTLNSLRVPRVWLVRHLKALAGWCDDG